MSVGLGKKGNLGLMAKHYYNKLTFRPYTVHRKIDGMDFNLFIADALSKDWYDTDNSHWPEMNFLKESILEPGESILECGAHHGVTACYIAKSIGPKGKIISFEPSPSNCRVIKKNLGLNNLNNVRVENKAIGEKPGSIRFSYFPNATIQSSKIGTMPVDVVNIDSYLDEKPTLLKLDIEGYEVEALKGAQKVLATKPKLAIEIHTEQLPDFQHTVKDVFDQLDLTDYECTVMYPDGFKPLGKIKDIKTNVHLFAIPK